MPVPAMIKSTLVAIPLLAGLALAAAAETVLNRGFTVAPATLDPHRAANVAETAILRDLFEGLTTYDAEAKLQPGAASAWTVSSDGLTWLFRLRDDARWSNGDPLEGADFVRAFQRLVDPATGSPHARLLAAVDNAAAIAAGKARPDRLGVDSPSPRHVRFTLTRPEPILPVFLADPAAAPLHEAAFAADGSLSSGAAVLTNGPYRLASWSTGQPVELTRNAKFREADSVAIDKVVYSAVADSDATLALFKDGKLDAGDGVPVYRLAALRKELGGKVRVAPFLGTFFLALNLRDDALAGRLTRQALALTIDREALASGPWGGTMVPAIAFVPPGIAGDNQPVASSSMTAGLDMRQSMALSLLEAAGHTAEKPLKLSLRIRPSDIQRATAEAVAKAWSALGVQTEIVEEAGVDLQRNLARGRFQVAALGWIGDYGDPAAFLSTLSGAREELNVTGYESADYDALLAEAATAIDPQARSERLRRAEAMLARDMPVIPLLHYASASLVADSVAGWKDNVLNVHPSRWLSLAAPAAASAEVTGTTGAPAPAAVAK